MRIADPSLRSFPGDYWFLSSLAEAQMGWIYVWALCCFSGGFLFENHSLLPKKLFKRPDFFEDISSGAGLSKSRQVGIFIFGSFLTGNVIRLLG